MLILTMSRIESIRKKLIETIEEDIEDVKKHIVETADSLVFAVGDEKKFRTYLAGLAYWIGQLHRDRQMLDEIARML